MTKQKMLENIHMCMYLKERQNLRENPRRPYRPLKRGPTIRNTDS